jgi:hypothetical protein
MNAIAPQRTSCATAMWPSRKLGSRPTITRLSWFRRPGQPALRSSKKRSDRTSKFIMEIRAQTTFERTDRPTAGLIWPVGQRSLEAPRSGRPNRADFLTSYASRRENLHDIIRKIGKSRRGLAETGRVCWVGGQEWPPEGRGLPREPRTIRAARDIMMKRPRSTAAWGDGLPAGDRHGES